MPPRDALLVIEVTCEKYEKEMLTYRRDMDISYSTHGVEKIFDIVQVYGGWQARLSEIKFEARKQIDRLNENLKDYGLKIETAMEKYSKKQQSRMVNQGMGAEERRREAMLESVDLIVHRNKLESLYVRYQTLAYAIEDRIKLFASFKFDAKLLKELLDVGIVLKEISTS